MTPEHEPAPDQVPTRRERVRAATIEEIKATAMRLMRETGPDLRFADIAREMGVTAPALYRYFADRDELLSALMVDGFHEFSAALTTALDATDPDDLAGRVRAAATAYRAFAKADPQRFALLFGLPNPGYEHSSHTSGHAAGATMARLEQLPRAVIEHHELPTPLVREVGPTLASEVVTAQAAEGARIPAPAYQALLHFLATVHGFACLESFEHLNWFSEEARDELFDAQIELLVLAMGGRTAGR
ncbi:MAG TPA: TetR/AcrR family transcriptional regulator [Acidimicrobiia bacterium]|nr:TetR/AcrR family transcriptional regulator [Acidimicrobiia bacterium]